MSVSDFSEADDLEIIRSIAARRGAAFAQRAFQREVAKADALALTIVSNAGVHPVPEEYIVGELYVASEGSFDFSSIETVSEKYDEIILNLHQKLSEKKWEKIYLFPFGHSTLCMAIKIAVYRVLRIETIDIFYFGNGRYDYLDRDTRAVITKGPV